VNASFLKTLVNRVVSANGGYVFNLRGRWRYETRAQRRRQAVSRPREWSGEVLAYAWLARQAKDRAKAAESARPSDAELLALTRS
jgi:hypothetical protein